MIIKSAISVTIFILFILTPTVQAQDVKVGSFKISSTSRQILGEELSSSFDKVLKKDEQVTWQVYVPETYDPSLPAGILLFQNYGALREPVGWKTVMENRNLILVRISVSGEIIYRKEMLLGVLSLPLLQQEYNIDINRVYSTAFNRCNVVGATAKVYPNIIKGSIYVNCIPTTWNKNVPERIDLMRDNKYVFIVSKNSSLKSGIRREVRRYNKNGIVNTKYSINSRLGANNNIRRRELLKAIDFLDNKQ